MKDGACGNEFMLQWRVPELTLTFVRKMSDRRGGERPYSKEVNKKLRLRDGQRRR